MVTNFQKRYFPNGDRPLDQIPRFLTALAGERRLSSILILKNSLNFALAVFEPNNINSVLSELSLSLFAESHFLT